jgi:hypothetical protein
MKRKNQVARLERKQRAWNAMSAEYKAKTKRPGSVKKP